MHKFMQLYTACDTLLYIPCSKSPRGRPCRIFAYSSIRACDTLPLLHPLYLFVTSAIIHALKMQNIEKCAALGLSHRGAPGRAWVSAASYMFFSGATRAAPFFLSQNAGVCLIALPIATRVAKLRASFETLVDAVRSSDRSRGASCDRQCSAGCAMTAETAVSGLSACCSV
mgnify:CR=1 FL=1